MSIQNPSSGGKERPEPNISNEELQKHDSEKAAAIESVLGAMNNMVGHAIIPFQLGGAVDMYYLPGHIAGTGMVTMEMTAPDGSGVKPNEFGAYELLAFTREIYPENQEADAAFNAMERRLCSIFTVLGKYAKDAVLMPGDTCAVPFDSANPEKGYEDACLIFDRYPAGTDLKVSGRDFHLLLCIEIFKTEMEYAMENGSEALLDLLKTAGYYPYSNLNRQAVV